MNDPINFDPYEPALQHIVLALVGALARSQPNPDEWLAAFQANVTESLDGWFPPGVPDHEAAVYCEVTKEAASALLNCISLRPPKFLSGGGS
jgi:hypothetical protein